MAHNDFGLANDTAIDPQGRSRGGQRIIGAFAVADFVGGVGDAVCRRQQNVRYQLLLAERIFSFTFVPRYAEQIFDGNDLLVSLLRTDHACRSSEYNQRGRQSRRGDELRGTLIPENRVKAIVTLLSQLAASR